jgi:hypothetical protein
MRTDLHLEAMAWLRFIKRMPIVCSEAGFYNADVFAACESFSIEVEAKRSRSDLRADFAHKNKHWAYEHATDTNTFRSPNYFYFIVPEELKDYALEYLGEKAPKYGLLWLPKARAIVTDDRDARPGIVGRRLENARKAQRLHAGKPSESTLRVATMRMSSELVNLYLAQVHLEANVVAALRVGVKDLQELAAKAQSGSPPEEP